MNKFAIKQELTKLSQKVLEKEKKKFLKKAVDKQLSSRGSEGVNSDGKPAEAAKE